MLLFNHFILWIEQLIQHYYSLFGDGFYYRLKLSEVEATLLSCVIISFSHCGQTCIYTLCIKQEARCAMAHTYSTKQKEYKMAHEQHIKGFLQTNEMYKVL